MTDPAIPVVDSDLPVIEVKGVTKEYSLSALESLRSSIKRMLGRPVEDPKRFKALDNVSFSIRRGEVVGIIGHNGAGKSTLLKHLCNITTPTSGEILVRGRIAPMIEVGAGLIGDMTGRENIFLNASILGMSREEIEAKFDDIVQFSELEKFIDTPIKRYSSGMQVRLGFAVATAVESEILVVDEVLAVGDISFQQKCFDRIESIINDLNRTVIIVGHNVRQLERVCDRMIMMDCGRIVADGDTDKVTARYFADAQQRVLKTSQAVDNGIMPQYAADFIQVTGVSIRGDHDDFNSDPVMHGQLDIVVSFDLQREVKQPEFVITLHTLDFVPVLSFGNASESDRPSFSAGSHAFRATIDDLPLRAGIFRVRVAILNNNRQILWDAANIRTFSVGAGKVSLVHLPDSSLIHVPVSWDYM